MATIQNLAKNTEIVINDIVGFTTQLNSTATRTLNQVFSGAKWDDLGNMVINQTWANELVTQLETNLGEDVVQSINFVNTGTSRCEAVIVNGKIVGGIITFNPADGPYVLIEEIQHAIDFSQGYLPVSNASTIQNMAYHAGTFKNVSNTDIFVNASYGLLNASEIDGFQYASRYCQDTANGGQMSIDEFTKIISGGQ